MMTTQRPGEALGEKFQNLGYAGRGESMGDWYNSWTDFWGDVTSIASKVTGGSSGVNTSPVQSPGGIYTNDLNILKGWSDGVRASGGVSARMPMGPHYELINHAIVNFGGSSTNSGKPAARQTGPGTWYPDEVQLVYELAPQHVLDADTRILQGLANDQSGTLLNILTSLGLAPGIAGNAPNVLNVDWDKVTTYLLWGGVAVGAVLILPPLFSAIGRRR